MRTAYEPELLEAARVLPERVAAAIRPFLKMHADHQTLRHLRAAVEREVDIAVPRHLRDRVWVGVDTRNPMVPNVEISAPQFDHDCSVCQFLGIFEGLDLYTCDKQGYRTFIARFGDKGPEYSSSPVALARELWEAQRRFESVGS